MGLLPWENYRSEAMKVDARAFRALLETLHVFSASGQLVQGSNFCRLETGEGFMRATLPTNAGWLKIQLQAEVEPTDPSVLGVDLLLFRRTLRGVVWPRSGDAGQVELTHGTKGMTVVVPMWTRFRSQWAEDTPKTFQYPPTEMVFWHERYLPACTSPADSARQHSITTTADVWSRVIDGVEKSTAAGQDKPNLRNVSIIFRDDEIVAIATDGGQAAFSSETTAQALEGELQISLPAVAVRTVEKVLSKVKAASDPMTLSVVTTDQRRALHIKLEAVPIEMSLTLPAGGPPTATLEKLPVTTDKPAGVILVPASFVADLGIAAWFPGARVCWFVWLDN